MVTPAAKRSAVAHLVEAPETGERRACRAIGADRSSVRYEARRPDDAALRVRLYELAHEGRRFGYRRLHALLRREGHPRAASAPSASTSKRGCTRAGAAGASLPWVVPHRVL